MKKIFFRADSNESIGLGHVMRCLTIAIGLQKKDCKCTFLYAENEYVDAVQKEGIQEICLNTKYNIMGISEAEELLSFLLKEGAYALIVDSYFVTNEYLNVFKGKMKVICINSLQKKFDTDILINYSMLIDENFYFQNYEDTNTKLLLGSQYAPLRDEFSNIIFPIRPTVKKILVMTGGGDKYNFTSRLLENIQRQEKYMNINFVCVSGNHNTHYEELISLQKTMPNVEIIKSSNCVSELMQECDLILTAGGTTLYEMGAVGIPGVVFAVARDQVGDSLFLADRGAILYAGYIDNESFWKDLFDKMDELINNQKRRDQQSKIMKNVTDGLGNERICKAILEEL